MGRPTRRFEPGLPTHVVNRGNGRQPIFSCEADYRFLWQCLLEASTRFEVAVNAYVFMTNHFHLLLTPNERDSISRMMHWAVWKYSGRFNARYQRTGTLWEGRFRASLITSERYFFACHRYIDLNPVRAGIAGHPADYAWSSHRFYAYGERNPLITSHEAMVDLGFDDATRRTAYQGMFETPLEEETLMEIRASTNASCPIGTKPRRGRRSKEFVPGTNSRIFVPGTN
jgi:putative transposase